MECPKCDSSDVFNTDAMDATVINICECCHDYECLECGALFVIRYTPIVAEFHSYNTDSDAYQNNKEV
jgi:hypothetical protein